MNVKNLKYDKIKYELNFLLVHDGSHSACGSIPRESGDKIFKYLSEVFGILCNTRSFTSRVNQ